MLRSAVTVVVALVVVAAAGAADAPAKKPIGTWARGLGENKVTFQFKADSLTCVITNGSATLEVEADYGVTKDGVIYGIITKAERKGVDGGPEKGELFSFQVKIDKETITISDLKGTDNAEAKQLIQGEYKKQ
jgi:hypothetical protein